MENLIQNIENHYHKPELFEKVLKRLEEQGIDLNNVTRADIAAVDEFHVRGAAVSNELANLIHIDGARLLDVGCGLGGPCRMLADVFNCMATGIDISKEFIRTAKKLSELVALSDRTIFIHGDANKLPFEDNAFDVVWTQHVQMNLPDKKKFYSEINRVLANGSHFIYYDIFKNGEGEIGYPTPWANSPDLSFLFTAKNMEDILTELGLTKLQSTNQTKAGIDFFEGFIARLKESGPPNLGLNLLMGASTKTKILNLLNSLKKGSLILQSGVYKK